MAQGDGGPGHVRSDGDRLSAAEHYALPQRRVVRILCDGRPAACVRRRTRPSCSASDIFRRAWIISSGGSATRACTPSRSTRRRLPRCSRAYPVEQLEPWAWWDFSTPARTIERGDSTRSSYRAVRTSKTGASCSVASDRSCWPRSSGTMPADSAAIPTHWSKTDAVPESVVQSARVLREKLLEDPYRPRYHFCVPEDNGHAGRSQRLFLRRRTLSPDVPLQPQWRRVLLGAHFQPRPRSLATSSRCHRTGRWRRRLLQWRRICGRRRHGLSDVLDAVGRQGNRHRPKSAIASYERWQKLDSQSGHQVHGVGYHGNLRQMPASR